MKTMFRILFITILIEVILCVSVAAESSIPASWAKEDVEAMISAGLIAPAMQNGFSTNISRAEFSDVVVRVYEKAAKTNKAAKEIPDKFSDIATSRYRDSIKKAVTYGIASGVNKTEFQPESSITIEQCAVMIYRMMKALGADLSVGDIQKISFSDAAIQSSSAVDSIEYCAKAGLIRGTSTVKFTPSGKLTREQAYVILYNVGRTCGLFCESIQISDYGELAGSSSYDLSMCEENGKLYYMQVAYRRSDKTTSGSEPFYELWCADTATGKVGLYHKFKQEDFKDRDVFFKNLVAMDSENFYVVGRGIFAINRKSYQCRRLNGTEGVIYASAYKNDLYFSRGNQLCKYSFDNGKIKTILTFGNNSVSKQMSIVGNTIYVLSSVKGEREEGLYRADTDGRSVSYLGSELFRRLYFHKGGILAECTGFNKDGFQSSDQKVYEFGYGSLRMTHAKTERISFKSQILDGVLYRPFPAGPGRYKVLKSKEGQVLFSISVDDDMQSRCGDYYYFYEDALFYALNLRTGHAIQRYYDDARDFTDYYYKLAEKVNELVKPTMTDVEKAKAITDWICKTAEYDYPYYYRTANPPSPESGYALGLFYDGQIVCQGYTDAAMRMFQLAGLDCYWAVGKTGSGENHSWIHIKIEGKYYVIDVTWDDASQANQRYYSNFLIALKNYSNQYVHDNLSNPALDSIIFSEEDYPLSGITRGELYTIP